MTDSPDSDFDEQIGEFLRRGDRLWIAPPRTLLPEMDEEPTEPWLYLGPMPQGYPESGFREKPVDLQTRLFDAEAALAELVRLKDGPRDAQYQVDEQVAWSRARAVLAQIPCGDAPAPCNCDDPVLHRGH